MTVDPEAKESMYWIKNEEWYRVNRVKGGIELTDKAPERARKSFEMYQKRNGLVIQDAGEMTHAEKAALDAAALAFFKGEKTRVACPRCGNIITVHVAGNSYSVECETIGCIKETFRGI
jgi:hypothetical protein